MSADARREGRGAGSLRVRLLVTAIAWTLAALAIAGTVLSGLFREHVEAELAERMRGHLDQLTASITVAGDGRLGLTRELSEPLFRQPASGLYWLVELATGEGAMPLRSRSLWDFPLTLPPAAPTAATATATTTSDIERHEAVGPRGQPLVLWTRRIELPGAPVPVRVAVAADVSRLQAMSASFSRTLALSLGVLAIGLIGAAVLQVQVGLGPLRRLHGALRSLRSGERATVEGRFPTEVQPLVDELNGLLAENAALVEHARTQTGNLAHALKTPLAVIGNATAQLPPAQAALIDEQAQRMAEQVERHLVRARAAAVARARGPGQPVATLLADLVRTIERLHVARGLQIRLHAAPEATFRGEPADLQEMVGNLLDNAAKWAVQRVELSARREGARLCIEVDDDGPGIAPEQRTAVLQRGRRLDESRPGAGLGLAIVDDLARLHGGALTLDAAPAGGLRARLELPAGGASEMPLP